MHSPSSTVHPEKMLKPKILSQTSVQYLHGNHHVPAWLDQLNTPLTHRKVRHLSDRQKMMFTSSILHKSWHHCSNFGHHRSPSSQCQRRVLFPIYQFGVSTFEISTIYHTFNCECMQRTNQIMVASLRWKVGQFLVITWSSVVHCTNVNLVRTPTHCNEKEVGVQ